MPRTSPHFQFADANLIVRSADKVDFHVHKSIMSFASRVFRDMISLGDLSSASSLPMRVVDVVEESESMEALLRYIYPLRRPTFMDLEPIILLLEMADKYDIPIITSSLEDFLLLSPLAQPEPIGTYALAKKFGLRYVEQVMEPVILKRPWEILSTTQCSSEMAAITIHDLQRLEYYRSTRHKRAVSIISNEAPSYQPDCECQQRAVRENHLVLSYPPCVAWTSFVDLCSQRLSQDPTIDITSASLRDEAVALRRSDCREARANLTGHYAAGIEEAGRLVKLLPWTFAAYGRPRVCSRLSQI